MFGTLLNRVCPNSRTLINHTQRNYTNGRLKVTILGAGDTVGKSTALMLKQSIFIDELCLHDQKPLEGFASDLNYIDSKCKVTSYQGPKELKQALYGTNVVLVLNSAPAGEETNQNTIFLKNAPLIKQVAINIAKYAPKAAVAIATEPINSIVPAFSEIMKKQGSYNAYNIFGITTIDSVRANKFVAEVQGLDPECVVVPMIGGHTEKTMVPVLSQATPCAEFTNEELEDITNSVRQANSNLSLLRTEGSPLCQAFAVARFAIALVKAFRGQTGVVECAYVRSKAHGQLKYASTPLLLSSVGVSKNLGVPETMSDYEMCLFENAIPLLVEDIRRGEAFAAGVSDPSEYTERPECNPCADSMKQCPPDHCEVQSMVQK